MLLKRLAAAVFLVCLLPLYAQQANDRFAGRVVSSFDGRPVAHAAVTLNRTKEGHSELKTTADEDGRFSFAAVPPGNYRLSGGAHGYLTLPYQNHDGFFTAIVTGAGLDTTELVLQLDPTSSISGHIVDEAGEAVQFGRVTLYRDISGRVTRARNSQTDSDGGYDFEGLAPGRYFLTVTATPWYAVHPRIDRPQDVVQYRVAIDPALDVAYPLMFYPRALDSDGASAIVLAGGNQVTADMQLSPTPAISLTVRGTGGEAGTQRFPIVTRSVFGTDQPVQFQAMDNANGMMRISGFAPGQYKLEEITPDNRIQIGSTPLDLTSGSVTVDLPSRGDYATLAVNIHTANGGPPPPHIQLSIRAANGNQSAQIQVSEKGITEIHNVPPGSYRFALSGAGHPLNAVFVAVNGKTAPDKLLHITAGENVPVDLTVSTSIGTIEGVVRRDGKPEGGSMAVLVPASGDTSESLFRRDQSNLDGGFTFTNIIPGNYLIIAIDDAWSIRWNDPTVLSPYLLHAVPISIPATSSATIRLSEPVIAQPR